MVDYQTTAVVLSDIIRCLVLHVVWPCPSLHGAHTHLFSSWPEVLNLFLFLYPGSNRVAFLVSNYNPPSTVPESPTGSGQVLSPSLRDRLYTQPPLRVYLDGGQVLSWNDVPSERQVTRLLELTRLELNPRNVLTSALEQCTVL